jgi:Cu(I)/Ag(I) efflux system membrane fusion protein
MKHAPLILVLFAISTVFLGVVCNTALKPTDGRHHMTGKENIRTPEMMTETYKVAGNCDMCKKRIETSAKNIKGVTQADWNADKQTLTVMYFPQQTNGLEIQKTVAAVGHDTDKFKATDAAYKKLPSCCRYDRML